MLKALMRKRPGSTATGTRSEDVCPRVQHSRRFVVRQEKPNVVSILQVKVRFHLNWIPAKFCLLVCWPKCIKRHNHAQAMTLSTSGPSLNGKFRQAVGEKHAPKSVSSDWPLSLKVEDDLGNVHLRELRKVIKGLHSIAKMDHIYSHIRVCILH